MSNENEKSFPQIIRDIVIYLLLPLLGLGYWKIEGEMSRNGEILRALQANQIRSVEQLRNVTEDLNTHIFTAEKQVAERGRLHHTSGRSCMECKDRPGAYPDHSHAPTLPNPFLSK